MQVNYTLSPLFAFRSFFCFLLFFIGSSGYANIDTVRAMKGCPTILINISDMGPISYQATASGGAAPYTYSADGTIYTPSNLFFTKTNQYNYIYVRDANGCTGFTSFFIAPIGTCDSSYAQVYSSSSAFYTNYVVRQLGAVGGKTVLTYDTYSLSSKVEIIYNNTVVASTNVFVNGQGYLSFDYIPSGGINHCVVKVTTSFSGYFVMNMNCPFAKPTSLSDGDQTGCAFDVVSPNYPGVQTTNDYQVQTFTPTYPTTKMKSVMEALYLKTGDTLRIYDGASTTATLLKTYTGYLLGAGYDSVVAKNKKGQLTFEYKTGLQKGLGFRAKTFCSGYYIGVDPLPKNEFCAGEIVKVPFSVYGDFPNGNNFIVQLSDSTGSFKAPYSIGIVTQKTGGYVNGTIPTNTPPGSRYRIRIITLSPNIVSEDNGTDINVFDSTSIAKVSVSLIAGNNPGCIGDTDPLTFQANPLNGGSSPSYTWTQNGSSVGSGYQYTATSFANGDIINCQMIGNSGCAKTKNASSSPVNIVLNSGQVAPSVFITSYPSGPIDYGTPVVFSANVTNGGGGATYQWYKNGVAIQDAIYPTYSTAYDTLFNNDSIYCTVTSSLTCASPKTVTSNGIKTSVSPVYCIPAPTYYCSNYYISRVVLNTLDRSSNCDTVTGYSFLRGTTNTTSLKRGSTYALQVTTPSYTGVGAWMDFNQNGTFEISEKLLDTSYYYIGGVYYAQVKVPVNTPLGKVRLRVRSNYYYGTGNNPCDNLTYGETEDYQINIVDTGCVQPTVGLLDAYSGCYSLTVTATTNAPKYQWSGGATPNSLTNTFSASASGSYVFTATSASGCTLQKVTRITVLPNNYGYVSVYAYPDSTICTGSNISFSTYSYNTGSNPVYTWKVNGIVVGTNSTSFNSSTLKNGDTVTCTMASSLACTLPVTTTPIRITVLQNNSKPSITITRTPSGILKGGTPALYSATTVNVGGSPTYSWYKNGIYVGGGASYYETNLQNGDQVYCTVTSALACVSPKTTSSNVLTANVIQTYCSPYLYCGSYAYISRVVFNNIDRTSACEQPAGYGIFYNDSISTGKIIKGNTYKLSVGTSPNTYQGVTAWIDYNKNGVFDTSEVVLNKYVTTAYGITYDTLVTIPDTALDGNTVLRIITSNYANPGLNACSPYSSTGEYEDYLLNISTSTCTQPTATIIGSLTGCAADTLTATGGVSYSWNGGLFPKSATNVFTQSGMYTVDVTDGSGCTIRKGAAVVVSPIPTPSITIRNNVTTGVCKGTTITFSSLVFGAGTAPKYQWYRNNVAISGAIAATYSSNALNNKDSVYCIVSNVEGCKVVSVKSNQMTVNIYTASTPAGVSVSAYPTGIIVQGTNVTFTASPTNGGNFPSYQWKKNGVTVGTNSNVYSDLSLANGDIITCTMTSNSTCVSVKVATSAPIVIATKPFDGQQQFTSYMPANLVVGQPNFTSNAATQSQSTLNNPSYSAISSKGVLAVVDQAGNRAMLWKNFQNNGQPADIVLGQPDFVTNQQNITTSTSLYIPNGVSFSPDGEKLLIADYGNHRVLIWNSIPTSNAQPADVVVGQLDFNSKFQGSSATGLSGPLGIFVASDGKMFVSEYNNKRVLIWNKIPEINTAPADVVIGQNDLNSLNNSDIRSNFNEPWGLWVAPNGKLLVTDGYYNRVFVYNKVPSKNGVNPDIVIGQNDFLSTSSGVSASNFYGSIAASVSPDGKLAIGEFNNNRVVIFDSIPTTNGASASVVLGQPNMFTNSTFYPTGSPTDKNMYRPYNVSYDLYGRLFVTGREMNRVMVFGLKPTTVSDLGIAISGTTKAVCNSSNVNFTVTVTNNGSATARNVVATASIPATFQYVSHSSTGGTYVPASGYWTIDSLPAGKTISITLVGVVSSTNVSSLQAYANILKSNLLDTIYSNNATNTTITINSGTPPSGGDLILPGTVKSGNTITGTLDNVSGATNYVWSVANASTYTANGNAVSIKGGNPGDTILVSVTPTNTTCSGTTIVRKVIVTCPDSAANQSVTAGWNTTVKTGDTLFLTASTVAGASYAWVGPNGFIANVQNPYLLAASTALNGVYKVIVTVNGCQASGSDSVNVSVFDPTVITVYGKVYSPAGSPVTNVLINLNTTPTDTSDTNGEFQVRLDASNIGKKIKPWKNNDANKTNGISVADVLQLQGHILKKLTLNSPYKIIAGDLNGSGSLTTLDIIYLKRLALGIDTTFPGNKLWNFVDSAYVFPDPTNPFPYKDSILIAKTWDGNFRPSFIGVKLGDLNWDWKANVLGKANKNHPVQLYHDNLLALPAQTTTKVAIRAKDFKNLLGIQFTLKFDKENLTFKGIGDNAYGFDFSDQHVFDGKIAFLWNDPNFTAKSLADGTVLFELVFENKTGVLPRPLEINSDLIAAEAYDAVFGLHGVEKTTILQEAENAPVTKESWELSPNPTDDVLKVRIELSTDKEIVLSLSTTDGKNLHQRKIEGKKGTNQISLPLRSTLGLLQGAYFIRVIGLEPNAVPKQVILR